MLQNSCRSSFCATGTGTWYLLLGTVIPSYAMPGAKERDTGRPIHSAYGRNREDTNSRDFCRALTYSETMALHCVVPP